MIRVGSTSWRETGKNPGLEGWSQMEEMWTKKKNELLVPLTRATQLQRRSFRKQSGRTRAAHGRGAPGRREAGCSNLRKREKREK